ncbi:hypothetical protein [Cellulomonas xiejunii]|uniref:Uncharacterized protein n=1 Tax=Cellulomonas xiejunii TaxID=2968083 RepID=A0ABY5KL85_9CELL|nr:hypothetical protein [Cellulomonas xiejunii]MCC2312719.1 hypothetical protein [Cellulomonas xiejunii]MCC2320411.1 hypothetical protein [Cellulomonas xiejunii]UUI70708.1 hypothetical protein NP048_13000 [Cellulomonas xiejunii]
MNFDAAYLAKLELSGGYTATRQTISQYEYWNGQSFVSRDGCGGGFA